MATIAENCMTHLESLKEKEDMRRIKSMNLCLAAFVDPDHRVRRNKKRKARRTDTSIRSAKSDSSLKVSNDTDSKTSPKPDPLDNESQHSSGSTEQTGFHKKENEDYLDTFKIAAALLSKSLDIEGSSGVVFLDTGSSLHHVNHNDSSTESSEEEAIRKKRPKVRRRSGTNATQISYRSLGSRGDQTAADVTARQPSEVLSSSCEHTEIGPPLSTEFQYTPLSQSHLGRFIKKYPRGMLFDVLKEGANASSSSGEDHNQDQLYPLPHSKHIVPSEAEIAILLNHFPDARQVMFVPVWNPSWSRFSACFAINTNEFREFRRNPEFLHAIAFCNCATIELTRIATVAADQQKSDFIGSSR
jgi:hypothetical protein